MTKQTPHVHSRLVPSLLCLINAISNLLPFIHRVDVVHCWEFHFTTIWHWDNFSLNFHLLLQYNICVYNIYYNASLNFIPAAWHQGVWDQVITWLTSSNCNPFRRECSLPVQVLTSLPLQKHDHSSPHSLLPAPPAIASSAGLSATLARKPAALKMAFLFSLVNGLWQTAHGEQVCLRFNGKGCSIMDYSCLHLYSKCSRQAYSSRVLLIVFFVSSLSSIGKLGKLFLMELVYWSPLWMFWKASILICILVLLIFTCSHYPSCPLIVMQVDTLVLKV